MRIGEAAVAAGVSAKTLRFYESRGLLSDPDREANGYRDYAPEVVGRIGFIRRGRAAGLTLAQIEDLLAVRDAGEAPCGHVTKALARHLAALDAQIAELTALRAAVATMHRDAAAANPSSCDAGEICSFL